jgi:hypothetical protein
MSFHFHEHTKYLIAGTEKGFLLLVNPNNPESKFDFKLVSSIRLEGYSGLVKGKHPIGILAIVNL